MDAQKKDIRILIVDDQLLIRDGLKVMLESQADKYNFDITESETAAEAIRQCLRINFDIVLMDYQMPKMNGDEAIKNMLLYREALKILVLSNYDEYAYINNAIRAGARGYILKNIDPSQLMQAIETVLDGRIYYSNDVAVKLIDGDPKPKTVNLASTYSITKREMEILKLIVKEFTNEEIADSLCISKRTVDTHRQNLLNKLKVKNTAGLVKFAMEMHFDK
jgi:DNA-binding NarL/FixJ family response regulator